MLCSSIVPLSQVIQKGNNHRKRSFFCSFFVASEKTLNSEPPILGITRKFTHFFSPSPPHTTNKKKKTTRPKKRREKGQNSIPPRCNQREDSGCQNSRGNNLFFKFFLLLCPHKNHSLKTQWLVPNKPLVNPPVRSSLRSNYDAFVRSFFSFSLLL